MSNGTNSLNTGVNADRIQFKTAGLNYIQSEGALFLQPSGDLVFNGTGAEIMRIKSGRVGIGTSSPASTLEIAKNDQTNGATLSITNSFDGGGWDAGDTVGSIDFRVDDFSSTEKVRGQIKVFDDSASGSTYPFANAMSFSTGYFATLNERMRIDSSGRVGIGTDSPQTLLDISHQRSGTRPTLGAGTRLVVESTANNTAFTAATILGGNASGASLLNLGDVNDEDVGQVSYYHSDNSMRFRTNANERLRIDASGNLLVGTTSVQGAGGVTLSGAGYVYSSRPSSTAIYADRTGSDGAIQEFRKNGSTVGSISVTGTTTTYNTSSDQRLKDNIADADDAGSKIDAIQVRKYDWKADGSHQDYGMVAQELQTVAPEAVSGDADSEEMMGVDYSKLVPMLIKEIQSLRNRVAQLETGE